MDEITLKRTLSHAQKRLLVFVSGCLLGAAFFLAIYGFKVMDVQYVDWLMTGGDTTQHYLGWVFFRNSPWHFPIGLVDGLAYPALTSVMYTDSIPLFSLFFKLLSPILPETFQFFGIWGIMAFMLQGGISSLIIYKIKASMPVALIGSVFFIISPPVLQRMYGHTALAGHFMILLPIAVWFYQDVFKKGYREYIVWGALGILAVSIHGYFVPMIGGFLCGYLLDNYILQGFNWKKIASLLGIYLGCVLATMFILGAFHGDASMTTGFDPHSSNLNALFNSMGYSIFLPELPVGAKQHEGFAYLGFGMLLMAAVAVAVSIIQPIMPKNRTGAKPLKGEKAKHRQGRSAPKWEQHTVEKSYLMVCLVLVAAVFFLLSVGPADRSRMRLIIGMRQFILMFRAHGRFIWCTMYVIMLGVIRCISSKTSFRTGMTLLLCCATLQTVDLSGRMRGINDTFNRVVTYESKTITSEKWEDIARKYRHLVILPYGGEIANNMDNIFEFALFAGSHGMTVNQMYLARRSEESYSAAELEHNNQMAEGTASADTLFILEGSLLQDGVPKLELGMLDGYVLGSKSKIDGI